MRQYKKEDYIPLYKFAKENGLNPQVIYERIWREKDRENKKMSQFVQRIEKTVSRWVINRHTKVLLNDQGKYEFTLEE